MQLNIRGKNVKVNEDRKQLIEKKLGNLSHYFDHLQDALVELAAEKGRLKDERLIIEMTIRANGSILRGEERDSDLGSALDRLHHKMQRQITRYKERNTTRKGRTSTSEAMAILTTQDEPEAAAFAEPEDENVPVKVKTFEIKPMLPEEAVEEMELVGHDFFVFQEAKSQKFSVVYRRKDGAYGMLQPEMS